MAETPSGDDRLARLRERWERDSSSRAFLPLAEAYRQQGMQEEAVRVLEQGIEDHPNYLSALVALGRCRLDLDEVEMARAVLERVLDSDPTQMVAGKLLVEVHLKRGDRQAAEAALARYRQIAAGDPEIESFDRRLEALSPLAETRPAASGPGGYRELAALHRDTHEEAPFSLVRSSLPDLSLRRLVSGDRRAVASSALRAPFDLSPTKEDRHRYLRGLVGPGFSAPALAVPEEVVPPPVEEPGAPVEEVAAPVPPESAWEETAPPESQPTEGPSSLPAAEEAIPRPREEPATATLGELYLRQGHLQEAERIFRQVLARDPHSPRARRGLATIEAGGAGRLTAAVLLGADARRLSRPTERKILVLQRYLERMRRGASEDVPGTAD